MKLSEIASRLGITETQTTELLKEAGLKSGEINERDIPDLQDLLGSKAIQKPADTLTVTTARETDPDTQAGIVPSQPTGLAAQVPQTTNIPVPQVSQAEALRLQQVMQAAGMLSNAQVLAPEAIGLMNAALSGVSTGYAEAANMALMIQQRREGLNPFVVTSLLLAMGIQPTGDFEKDLETLTAASQPKPDHADYMALLQEGNSSIDELIQSTYQRLAV